MEISLRLTLLCGALSFGMPAWSADEPATIVPVQVNGWKPCQAGSRLSCFDEKTSHAVPIFDPDGNQIRTRDLSGFVPQGLFDKNVDLQTVKLKLADGEEVWVPLNLLSVTYCQAPKQGPVAVDAGQAHHTQALGMGSGSGCKQ